MLNRYRKATVQLNNPLERTPVPIVNDAAMATAGVGEGKLIPLLILDATERPDLRDLFSLQSSLHYGDHEIQWGKSHALKSGVSLMLSFKRPAKVIAVLDFDLTTQSGLVDLILTSKGLYLQLGKPGDRLMTTVDTDRMIVEIPDTGFEPMWETILSKHFTLHFRKTGANSKTARQSAKRFIAELRSINRIRTTGLQHDPPSHET